MDIAVAGRHGLALYSRRSARWRLFGDVSQEREITVHVSHQSSLAMCLLITYSFKDDNVPKAARITFQLCANGTVPVRHRSRNLCVCGSDVSNTRFPGNILFPRWLGHQGS